MISSLRGKLVYKSQNEIILDVNGVGYQIFISKKVFEKLTEINSEYSILTYLDVKENSLQLFGFIDEKEREMFKMLLSVSGIGPKIAHTILVNSTFEEIVSIVSGKSNFAQIKIPGLGQKKLELISMTLKDKIYKIDKEIDVTKLDSGFVAGNDFSRLEALNALMNLGYVRSDAEKIIREVMKQSTAGESMTTEEIIRKSLEYISK